MKIVIESEIVDAENIEYQSNLIKSQINSKLIDESINGLLEDGIFSIGLKKSLNIWEYEISKKWKKSLSTTEKLHDLIKYIYNLINTKNGSWFSKIIKKIYIRQNKFFFETRFDINNLNFLLTDLSLSIKSLSDINFGKYYVSYSVDNNLILCPYDSKLFSFEFLPTKNREEGKILYSNEKIDICWGIGVPEKFFLEPSNNFSTEVCIPLLYYINAGRNLSSEDWFEVEELLTGYHSNLNGVIATNSRIKNIINNKVTVRKYKSTKKIPLYYSLFDPNKDLAYEISKFTNGKLEPIEVPYKNIVDNSPYLDDGITLSIKGPKHCGIMGNFPEVFIILDIASQKKETIELKEEIINFYSMENISKKALFQFEKKINSTCRQLIVGRIRPRFRTSIHDIPMNTNGIISLKDFSIE